MSKIDELIREYCPEGVEFKPLEQVASIKRGRRVTKSDLIIDGAYPVYSGGVTPMGHYDKFNQPADTVTVVKYGTAGFVNYITEEFWANDVCYCIKPKEVLSNKYLFYVLKSQQTLIQSQATDAIPAHLPTDVIGGVRIPVPPLEVQKEIVKILDTFTQLEAELSAELEARKAQYEHYRNQLLTFDDAGGVRWTTLGEICDVRDGTHDSPKTSNTGFPLATSKNITSGLLDLSSAYLISSEDYEMVNKRSKVDKWDILITMIGTVGETVVVKDEPNFAIKNMGLIKVGDELLSKFINFYLSSDSAKKYIARTLSGSTQKFLSLTLLRSFPVPMPLIDQQILIVSTLDKFETLTKDISIGLPAEITARRQQYEYYRSKLLTFKELPS